jgi:hypothetical protein
MDKQYIGKKLISSVVDVNDDKVLVTFKKDDAVELPKKVFDLIVTTDLQEGELHEIVQQKLAYMLLEIMKDYAIPIYQIPNICSRIENTVHNMTQEKIAEKFEVKNYSDILVNHIL